MLSPAQPQVYWPHLRVIEQAAAGVATITILPPRNPLKIRHLFPLLLGIPVGVICMSVVGWYIRTGRLIGGFVLVLFAALAAWAVAAIPDLLNGLHTRVAIVVTPDDLTITTHFGFSRRTKRFRRDQVLGVRTARTAWGTRGLHVRFKDDVPLEIMAGYPNDQITSAAGALRQALAAIAPATPVLQADDPATLPYAKPARPYEVEILRLADGVSVTVPPPRGAGMRLLGGTLFVAVWLALVGTMFYQDGWRTLVCPLTLIFPVAGIYGLTLSIVMYLRRNEPLLIALTPAELVVDNAPWKLRTLRIPRSAIKSIVPGRTERDGRPMLAISWQNPREKVIELMTDRELDEIERVAEALNETL